MHGKQALPWHNRRRLAHLDNLHKLSVWCRLGTTPDPKTIWRRHRGRGRWLQLLAGLSSYARFQTGFFGLPWDINLLHRHFKSVSDFDIPD